MANRKKFLEPEPLIDDANAETAFWIYYQLGEKRTLNKVAKKTGLPLTTIQYWSRKFNWAQRVKDNEELMNDSVAKKKMATLAKTAQMKAFALYMSVLEDKNAKPADKMKAAEKLQELSEKSDKIKDIKKIAIKFPNIENFKQKLKEAGVKVVDLS